ncbi:5-formyltetrahydrofolate cyclo-ligase [Phaeobacter sp. B1627]|uniref:5-formyltetrahydrofolate cyclo-ligase n=1 Tax=Phaeobacter sp. B1627 TaxID=2583809 RepID=UPI00111B58DE|nr:5-formyltetrahydrofolate cyclo-ligase [Phaeobacter sp. B1627]TNJ48635.1 5-formyltetrahydrofolate cyclo-ligase [Phaeobacter sp. B1627]
MNDSEHSPEALLATKAAARKAAFVRRKAAFESQRPGVAGHLAEVLAGYRGVPLAGYMPIRTEIDPRAVMAEAAAHGPVAVPVIQGAGQPLRFSRWHPDGPLRDGPFGARVPQVDDYLEPEILIVPLVAFDIAGNRLGYGGGFYDRTLEGLRNRRATLAIGFAFDAQEARSLPLEPTDQPLDMIVTESRILDITARG